MLITNTIRSQNIYSYTYDKNKIYVHRKFIIVYEDSQYNVFFDKRVFVATVHNMSSNILHFQEIMWCKISDFDDLDAQFIDGRWCIIDINPSVDMDICI